MPIYRKGEGQMDADGRHTGLRNAAVKQRIGEMEASRKNTPAQQLDKDIESGVQGARNAVNLNMTVGEMEDQHDSLKGPVSGSAMARLKDIKIEKKRTEAKEKKRR
jgi:hypothetical protein